jgi:hypothetical protein
MTSVSSPFRLPAAVGTSRQKYLTSVGETALARRAFLTELDRFVKQEALPSLAKTFTPHHYAEELKEILLSLGVSIDHLIIATSQEIENSDPPILPSGKAIDPDKDQYETPSSRPSRDDHFVIQRRISLGLLATPYWLVSIAGKDPDHIVSFLDDSLLNAGIKDAMWNCKRISRP